MAGGKDGQTLFHRILLATAGGLTNTIKINCHLKVKDRVQSWSSQRLLRYNQLQHAKN